MKNVSVNYQSLSGHLAVVKVLHDFCLKSHKYIHILWGTKLPGFMRSHCTCRHRAESFKVPQETKRRCKIDILCYLQKNRHVVQKIVGQFLQ